eukprot:TRINITY_DN31899_c0_g1_i1.p1 TRINITY_DN31899_c0_g1~~TRINITY_DN31899_c0_g1_i1.p1  ORF type:complete len:602 (+),score=137.94 TRINITY_DN31899_c0_g1_i1:25-1806(+)
MWWNAGDPQWQQLAIQQCTFGLTALQAMGTQSWAPAPSAPAAASGTGATAPKAISASQGQGTVLAGRAAKAAKAAAARKAAKNGLLVRLSSRVQAFEDALSASAEMSSEMDGRGASETKPSAAACLRDLVLRGLGEEMRKPPSVAKSSPLEVSDSESSRGSRRSRRNGRRRGSSASPPSNGEERIEVREQQKEAPDLGYAEVACHLRNFLECGGWGCCALEQGVTSRSAASSSESLQLGRPLAWQRLRAACAQDGATARGWVCSHIPRHKAALVRIVAVELPATEELRSLGEDKTAGSSSASSTSPGEGPLPLLPPTDDDGLFGLLPAGQATEPSSESESTASMESLPKLGALLRVHFVRGEGAAERHVLRDAGASCTVSLLCDRWSFVERLPGILSGTRASVVSSTDADGEWPEGGVAASLCADLRQSMAAAQARSVLGPCAVRRAKELGLRKLHASLLVNAQPKPMQQPEGSSSLGMNLSRIQGRAWADRRVREGVARARAGDQKAAIERYDAALDLCPQHKEGLVGRGAALTNLGRAREALRDFDAALRIDPQNSNAIKYRDIARKRLCEDGNGAGSADDGKRRRTPASS